MTEWLHQNMATVIIIAVLALLVILAVGKIVKDKKNGVSACGGDCTACPYSADCRSEEKQQNR